jgi:hypothetical protein
MSRAFFAHCLLRTQPSLRCPAGLACAVSVGAGSFAIIIVSAGRDEKEEGHHPIERCLPLDVDMSGDVSVDELVAAVNAALAGCN